MNDLKPIEAQLTFDYTQLDSEMATTLQTHASEIKVYMARTVESILEVGKRLKAAQDLLANHDPNKGEFQAWIKAEFQWSQKQAYRFINVYDRFGTHVNLTQLDIATSALYALAAPGTPQAARDEAITLADHGEPITFTSATALIETAKADPIVKANLLKAAKYIDKFENPLVSIPHVAKATGFPEWYTPEKYLVAARRVLGTIDLDPASSHKANKLVNATTYYTTEDSGLIHDWQGTVWLNPPYTTGLIEKFCKKLRHSIERQEVTSAITLTNNATETAWFFDLVSIGKALIFPTSRIKFYSPEKGDSAPLQGQTFVYFGDSPQKFLQEFSQFGWGVLL